MYNNIDLETIDITKTPPMDEHERQYYFMAKDADSMLKSAIAQLS